SPMVSMRFAAPRTFNVQDLDRARVENARVEAPASLDQDGVARIAQPAREFRAFSLLNQRLAAGDFHQSAAVTANLLHHLIDRHLDSAGESVFAVARRASQVAPCQPHEGARQAGERRLALNRMKNFSDSHLA